MMPSRARYKAICFDRHWYVIDTHKPSWGGAAARYRGEGAELMARARAIVLNDDEGVGRTNDASKPISNGT
jgi:hypothetical protein